MKKHEYKYPKLTLLLVLILFSFWVFTQGRSNTPVHDLLASLGLLGIFISGIFYSYGFTATLATAVLLVIGTEQNIYISSLVGGMGALLSDILIFLFVRANFNDEINKFRREKVIKALRKEGKHLFGSFYAYLMFVVAGFLVASPLPTEIGVSLFAGIKDLSFTKFIVIAFLLHSIGIFIILNIASSL